MKEGERYKEERTDAADVPTLSGLITETNSFLDEAINNISQEEIQRILRKSNIRSDFGSNGERKSESHFDDIRDTLICDKCGGDVDKARRAIDDFYSTPRGIKFAVLKELIFSILYPTGCEGTEAQQI